MNNKNLLTKLASLAIKDDGKIDKKVRDYALSNLTRTELAVFLRSVKRLVSQNFVTVKYNGTIPDALKRGIQQKYKDKGIIYEDDKNTNDGVKIITNDTLIDLSISGYVNNALNILKK